MSNNDVKIDHEAAKRYAAYIGDMARDHVCGQDDVNLSAAYLDAMAQRVEAEKLRDVAYGLLDVAVKERDEALALLEEYASVKRAGVGVGLLAKTRLFLAKHRKTGANDGK